MDKNITDIRRTELTRTDTIRTDIGRVHTKGIEWI
jgi:hypothetical protein